MANARFPEGTLCDMASFISPACGFNFSRNKNYRIEQPMNRLATAARYSGIVQIFRYRLLEKRLYIFLRQQELAQ
jgi:hypothetical protein